MNVTVCTAPRKVDMKKFYFRLLFLKIDIQRKFRVFLFTKVDIFSKKPQNSWMKTDTICNPLSIRRISTER